MEKDYVNLPIERFEVEDVDDDLARVKIYVMHDGKNLKSINFNKNAMDDAKDTLKNKPLIGCIEKNQFEEMDFKGHEIKYKIIKRDDGSTDVETIYIEQPLGLIPETNDYHYEKIDGVTWCVVTGYIWKEYCKEAFNILKENDKTISMEIRILEKHKDDEGQLWIDKFKYLGITILGDSHMPAMGNDAVISLYEITESEQFMSTFEDISYKLYEYIENNKKKSEVKQMEDDKKTETIENIPETSIEKDKFEFSVEKLREIISKELNSIKIERVDYDGERYLARKYWLRDILTQAEVCIVFDNETDLNYGIKYTINNDLVTLDYDTKVEYVVGDWRPVIKNNTEASMKQFTINTKFYDNEDIKHLTDKIDGLNEIIKTKEDSITEDKGEVDTKDESKFEVVETEEYKALNGKYTELLSKYDTDVKELERLQKFESDILKDKKIKDINTLFENYKELNEVDGFEEFKTEAIEDYSKYSLDEIDTKLAVMFTKSYKEGKFSTGKKEEKSAELTKMPIEQKQEKEEQLYGGLFEKYL